MRAVRETDELREPFEVRCRENFGRTEFESCELRCFDEWFSSFASGTAKSHCEPSTGDAKASAEYAAVATPAIPEVTVHK